jgi:hypothetical protein
VNLESRLRAKYDEARRWGIALLEPRRSHTELQRLAEALWVRVFPDRPWPQLVVRWSRLPHRAPDGITAVGRCWPIEKKILVDEDYVATRPERLARILVHEFAHVLTPGDNHGRHFQRVLKRARRALNGNNQAGEKMDGKRTVNGDRSFSAHRPARRLPQQLNDKETTMKPLTLQSAHASRLEYRDPGQPGPAEIARRIQLFAAELERRRPGASALIKEFRPFVRDGVWHPGAVLRRPSKLDAMTRRHAAQRV